MNIAECKKCRHHISEFYGSALCGYNSYPKLYTCVEIDETKNVACPHEYCDRCHTEKIRLGPEH